MPHAIDLRIHEDESVRVEPDALREFVTRCYVALGMEPSHARTSAEVLLAADLLGKDTHGVALLSGYMPNFRKGMINPRPQLSIVKETPNTALVDGDNGLGSISGHYGMSLAITKAKDRAVGVVTVRNSRHYGAAGVYSMMALEHDLIGIAMTNASPQVAPTYGAEGRFGTNPIAVAVPAGRERYWALDMATSAVPHNKVLLAARLGRTIPAGWVTDKEGHPITDPAVDRNDRLLMPLGGTPEGNSYKGYGLAIWVDIMCGILSGHGFGTRLPEGKVGHFFAAIDVQAFVPITQFKEMMDQMLQDLRDTPTLEGEERVIYAGEPEREVEADRRARGIPLHPSTLHELQSIAAELEILYDLPSAPPPAAPNVQGGTPPLSGEGTGERS